MQVDFRKCPVPILQDPFEFGVLLDIYKQLNPATVLEVGSFFGGTLWYWNKHATALKTMVVVDMPITPFDERYNQMVKCRAMWKHWFHAKINLTVIDGNSRNGETVTKVGNVLKQNMVDFLFIDGGHDSTTVTADYNNYSRYVRNDGVIAFHDTMHEMGVKNLWLRIKHGRKMVEINKQYGIGVLWK